MKKLVVALFILALSVVGSRQANATHIVGGDIFVEWLSQNNYKVQVRVYRDCNPGNAAMPTSVTVGIYDLVTDAQVQNLTLTQDLVNPQLVLGDSCYTPTGICVDEGIFSTTVTLADNPNGYYLNAELFARNNIIDNITNPGGTGMAFYAEMPDPALGQNSSPDFGPYPTDGYLCTSYRKQLDFNVTDDDGDSLVFSFVDPLDAAFNGTSPAPYTPITWQPPYSLADICGGTPPMDIDPQTGTVSAQPAALGVYVFSVRVEEFRNGVKIGETRRDMQYAALNCATDAPPLFAEAVDTIVDMPVGQETCFDIIAQDSDAQDTIFLEVNSSADPLGGYYQESPPIGPNQHPYGYLDIFSGQPDTLILPDMNQQGNLYYQEGSVAMQYCWTPTCQHIVDTTYTLYAESFSLGCSGSDTTQKIFQLNVVPPVDQAPEFIIAFDTTRSTEVLQTMCFDIIVDDPDSGDTLYVNAFSPSFGLGATATIADGYHYWWNDGTGQTDSVLISGTTAHPSGGFTGTDIIGFHYCWKTECEFLDPIYPMRLEAYSIGYCGDTIFNEHELTLDIEPIIPEYRNIPNVFTPNGDGLNDVYTIDGDYEPCFDTVDVKIYNRWGQVVFESNDPNFEWDGTNKNGNDVAEGTYFMIINGVFASEDIEGINQAEYGLKQFPITLFRDN